MERKYCKYPSTPNPIEYLEIQRVFKSATKSAREKYYSYTIRTNRNYLKMMYNTINDLLGNGVVRTLPFYSNESNLAEETTQLFHGKIETIPNDVSASLNEKHVLLDI